MRKKAINQRPNKKFYALVSAKLDECKVLLDKSEREKEVDREAIILTTFDFSHLKHQLYRSALGVSAVFGFNPKENDPFRREVMRLGGNILLAARDAYKGNVSLDIHVLHFFSIPGFSEEDFGEALSLGIELAAYSFKEYRRDDNSDPVLATLLINGKKYSTSNEAKGTLRARNLVNRAPRDCTPTHLVAECRELASFYGLKLEVLDRKKLTALGANTLLAVAQGSSEEPYLIKLSYTPAQSKGTRPKAKDYPLQIALVGKGITFDSGGLSIKGADSMMDMKFDMAGAAAVIGAMEVIAIEKPHAAVTAYIPTCENMISGSAIKPGDVVKSLSGEFVEILNTDAEGRLILADALALAEADGNEIIIDIATLTGACVVALGTSIAGLFSRDDALVSALKEAASYSGEDIWHLPLPYDYNDLLKSKIADLRNITLSRWGGAITAALFLENFVKKSRHAHLDIAGPAYTETPGGFLTFGGTGFGVRTLAKVVSSLSDG